MNFVLRADRESPSVAGQGKAMTEGSLSLRPEAQQLVFLGGAKFHSLISPPYRPTHC